MRDATRGEHHAVDALFSRFDLSRRSDYAAFLAVQAAAHVPVEQALEAAGAQDVLEDWPACRRASLLMADLDDLGVRARAAVSPPVFSAASALLGGLYVVEGSRLGASVLRRRVVEGGPLRFLAAAAPMGSWSRLQALLEANLQREADLAAAIDAARAVFRCFELAATSDLETLVAG